MRTVLITVMALAAVVAASERSQLEIGVGGGAWMPAVFDSDAGLSPGPAVELSLQIPPSLGNVFVIETGYLSCGSDSDDFSGAAALPLTVGYRVYPFYRTYAGPRGIEPLLGLYGGGMLLWDSPEGNAEKTNTGAGVIGAELGARIHVSEAVSLDLIVSPQWIPAGSAVAGETDKDMSGLQITASMAF